MAMLPETAPVGNANPTAGVTPPDDDPAIFEAAGLTADQYDYPKPVARPIRLATALDRARGAFLAGRIGAVAYEDAVEALRWSYDWCEGNVATAIEATRERHRFIQGMPLTLLMATESDRDSHLFANAATLAALELIAG